MRKKKEFIQYVLLTASFFMLLSVVLPHHHHHDGRVCYKWPTASETHGNSPKSCDCSGHNLAFYTNVQSHTIEDGHAFHYLFPLQILYAYHTELFALTRQFFDEFAVYVESLHGIWIAIASGLRAPPMY